MNSRHSWMGDVRAGGFAFVLTSAPALCGIMFTTGFLQRARSETDAPVQTFVSACFHFDAGHYADILEHGYSYDPSNRSNVAFFPVYPLAGQVLAALTGWDAPLTLLVLANVMLLGAFVFLAAYLRSRFPEYTSTNRFLILALFGLAPAGFFFRMPYSESTFLFLTLASMVGMARRWPLLLVALLTGAVTAVRPVGVAVAAAFLCHIVFDAERGPIKRRLLIAMGFLLLACWGLIAYMSYQYIAFDAPLGFAQTQDHWNQLGGSPRGVWDKVESLLSGEPIWGAYTGDPLRTWQSPGASSNPLFNLFFWNPIVFVATAVLIIIGARKSWLTRPEVVLSFFLLAIPYVTRAYEMCMASQARFAAVVFPAYIVLGRLLGSLPEWVTWAVIGTFTMMLMTWTALFAAGQYLF